MDVPTLDSAPDSQVDNRSSSGHTSATPIGERFRTLWILTCGATLALCILVVFRPFWISRGDLILSDPVDGRFSIAILEHWNRVFHSQVPFTSPNFFFPEKGVLGYSEAFFLLSLPFSLLRQLGIDVYLAFEITLILVTAIGFVSMLYLLRSILGFRRSTSLLGAYLFVTFNIYYIHFVHPQLVSVAFLPLILVLALKSWEFREISRSRMRACVSAAGALLGLTFFTSFYIAWFGVLYCTAIASVYLGLTLARRPRDFTRNIIRNTRAEKWTILLAASAFAVALIPFLITYVPAVRRTGTRLFGDTLYYMVSVWGALDPGVNNFVWGQLSSRIEQIMGPAEMREHAAGWPLLTLAVFLASGAYSAICIFTKKWQLRKHDFTQLMFAITLASLTLWFVTTRIGNDAPGWRLIWKFVPAAKAIRVPQRVNLVLNIGMIIVCVFGLEQLSQGVGGRSRWRFAVAVILASGLIVEQINSMPTHIISRSKELTKLASVPSPPNSCSEFYVSGGDNGRFARLALQVDGMLIAERFGIPTINGYSGWFPRDWNLLYGSPMQIAEGAREWAEDHDLSQFCAFDSDSNVWSSVNVHEPVGLGEVLSNAVQNSGFESSDLTPWLTFQQVHAARTDMKVHGGRHSVEESGGAGSIYQDVASVEPDVSYALSAWLSGSPDAIGQLAVYDIGTGEVCYSAARHANAGWVFIVDPCRVHGTRGIRIHLFKNTDGGRLYWDDVQLNKAR